MRQAYRYRIGVLTSRDECRRIVLCESYRNKLLITRALSARNSARLKWKRPRILLNTDPVRQRHALSLTSKLHRLLQYISEHLQSMPIICGKCEQALHAQDRRPVLAAACGMSALHKVVHKATVNNAQVMLFVELVSTNISPSNYPLNAPYVEIHKQLDATSL